jgi:hypothetical protein
MSLTEIALPEEEALALQEGFNGLVIVIVIVNATDHIETYKLLYKYL